MDAESIQQTFKNFNFTFKYGIIPEKTNRGIEDIHF